MDVIDKRVELLKLAKLRQSTRWHGYTGIGDHSYYMGKYECDFVSPYTKSGGNVDADILVLLQDWSSDESLRDDEFAEETARRGYTRELPTNKKLIEMLHRTFDLALEDIYATNLFPFVKPGRMSARIPQKDLIKAARTFALPQIEIVNPKLVICLGLVTFNAIRRACDLSACQPLQVAIENSFNIGPIRVWCQAHTGTLGQNNRNRDGVNRVLGDWLRMKADALLLP